MVVMAISETHGFGAASYDDVAWANARSLVEPRFSVANFSAWRPTVVAGVDRSISIAPGWAQACGVSALNGAASTVTFGANAGASIRYDALVARFDWTTRTATLVALPGGSVAPAINGSTTTPNTALVNRIPGKMYDAWIALVGVRPSVGAFAAGDVTDVRVWSAAGSGLVTPVRPDYPDAPEGAIITLQAGPSLPTRTVVLRGTTWRYLGDRVLVGSDAEMTALLGANPVPYEGLVAYRTDIGLEYTYRTGAGWTSAARQLATSQPNNPGWNFNVPGQMPMQFWKDQDNIVHVIGNAMNLNDYLPGAVHSWFTLPAGFRPVGWVGFSIVVNLLGSGNSAVFVQGDLDVNGQLRCIRGVPIPAGFMHQVSFEFPA